MYILYGRNFFLCLLEHLGRRISPRGGYLFRYRSSALSERSICMVRPYVRCVLFLSPSVPYLQFKVLSIFLSRHWGYCIASRNDIEVAEFWFRFPGSSNAEMVISENSAGNVPICECSNVSTNIPFLYLLDNPSRRIVI